VDLLEKIFRGRRRSRSPLPSKAAAELRRNAAPGVVERRVPAWRRELRSSRFAVLRGLFAPLFVGAVREYYRRLQAEGHMRVGEGQRPGAPILYDEELLSFLGRQLTPVVRAVTGDRSRYTFSFLRLYEPGAVLASHRDAPVCRWNIDLIVGGDPAPDRRSAWPLWIDCPGGARAVRLGLGDGLLYRGTEVPHWRRPQPASRTTVLAALHYGAAPLRKSGRRPV
jgi:hypothetical protein